MESIMLIPTFLRWIISIELGVIVLVVGYHFIKERIENYRYKHSKKSMSFASYLKEGK